jgi:hypothetical protein
MAVEKLGFGAAVRAIWAYELSTILSALAGSTAIGISRASLWVALEATGVAYAI